LCRFHNLQDFHCAEGGKGLNLNLLQETCKKKGKKLRQDLSADRDSEKKSLKPPRTQRKTESTKEEVAALKERKDSCSRGRGGEAAGHGPKPALLPIRQEVGSKGMSFKPRPSRKKSPKNSEGSGRAGSELACELNLCGGEKKQQIGGRAVAEAQISSKEKADTPCWIFFFDIIRVWWGKKRKS